MATTHDDTWRCATCNRPVEEGSLYCEDDPFCGLDEEPPPLHDTREESEWER